MSTTRPPRLDSSIYEYWKVVWHHPVIIDDKKVEVLKLRDQWSTSENKTSSSNYKAKTAIYNAIDIPLITAVISCALVMEKSKPITSI
ncbi:unnamed protein product [Brassica rapa]|uniref:Uncharacterized protein n=2 Tax=Brassica TaxID=3705 RepID=A0A8D9GIS5_BRACM|nr:unnamed protein product [Brassica napus]CAG7881431.1 unnamed protein product [Brassica rapa]